MIPKNCCKYIYSSSTSVSINVDKVKKIAKSLIDVGKKDDVSIENWSKHPLHPKEANLEAIAWIFFIDTINFSFWPDTGSFKFAIEYNDNKYTGYWSICAALNRALKNNHCVTNAEFMSQLSEEKFRDLFASSSDSEIPLVKERVEALNEAGKVLLEKFGGHFSNCVIMAKKSAVALLQIIVDNFISYRDEAVFHDRKVSLYKRAQILIADIWCCFRGQGLGEFLDIDQLTAFADYRVPQVLLYFGALEYSAELRATLEKGEQIPNGDPREVEIRGVTLYCVEKIVEEMKELLSDEDKNNVNAVLVDNYLWDYRRENCTDLESVPMHRTRTIFY